MKLPIAVAAPAAPARRRHLLVLLFLWAAGLGHLAGGNVLLWQHMGRPASQNGSPVLAALLVLLGVAQLRLAWRFASDRQRLAAAVKQPKMAVVQWLLVGLVACYCLGLVAGPQRQGAVVFWIAAAGWLVLCQLAVVAGNRWQQRLAACAELPGVRIGSRLVYLIAVLALAGELGARVLALVCDDPISRAYIVSQCKLSPSRTVDADRNDNDRRPAALARPGIFRVVVLSDDLLAPGGAQKLLLAHTETRLPGVELYNFSAPGAGPREYAALASRELAVYRPNLVLAVISVGDDVQRSAPEPSVFDPQQLHLYRACKLWLGPASVEPSPLPRSTSASPSESDYLRRAASELSVCRTPINATMRKSWTETLGHLDDLVTQCREQGAEVALVIVPGVFQVDTTLRGVLQRRAGYREEEFDLDLPQRRLTSFARQHELPLLDLLPHLAASSEPVFERHQNRLSQAGSTQAAEVLGAWMQSRYGAFIAADERMQR